MTAKKTVVKKPVETVKKTPRIRRMTSSTNKKYEMLTSTGNTKTIEDDGRKITLYRIRLLKTIHPEGAVYHKGEFGGWIENENCLSFEEHDNAWVHNDAMVYGSSVVYGNARVYANAVVKNRSKVYGDSRVTGRSVVDQSNVFGNAIIRDDAKITNRCYVSGSALIADTAELKGPADISGITKFLGVSRLVGPFHHGEYNSQIEIHAGNFDSDTLINNERGFIVFTNVGSENSILTVSTGANGLVVNRGCFSGTTKDFIAKSVRTHKDGSVINKEYRALIRVAETRLKPIQKLVDKLVAYERQIASANLQVRDAS